MSSSILESIDASEEEVEIFFLLYGFVACMRLEIFSDRFIDKMADLSKDGRVRLKRLLPDVMVLTHPEVPPRLETGLKLEFLLLCCC